MNPFDIEKEKYEAAYKSPGYKMGGRRKTHATSIISKWSSSVDEPKSLLDVGCGRGEIVEFATSKGFRACGTEIVSYLVDPSKNIIYAEADDLPLADNSFDYITCLDVIEHLIPGTEIEVFKEFKRVARSRILMSIANFSDKKNGVELHINIKPYEVWDNLIREIFRECEVVWHPKGTNISETWEVILA